MSVEQDIKQRILDGTATNEDVAVQMAGWQSAAGFNSIPQKWYHLDARAALNVLPDYLGSIDMCLELLGWKQVLHDINRHDALHRATDILEEQNWDLGQLTRAILLAILDIESEAT